MQDEAGTRMGHVGSTTDATTDGGLAAVVHGPGDTLPKELTTLALANDVPLGLPRFTAVGDEVLPAIFEWWNLLDAQMFHYQALYRYQTGYVREVQLRRMIQLVRSPSTKVYCEIGLNGGHSVSAMLLANPNASAHVFDTLAMNYSRPVVSLLQQRFGPRFRVHEGNSRHTVREWRERLESASRAGSSGEASGLRCGKLGQEGGRGGAPRGDASPCPVCDFVFVDGDHSLQGASADISNVARLAVAGAKVVVDDYNAAPGKALRDHARGGLVHIDEVFGPYPARHRLNPCSRTISTADCRARAASDRQLARCQRIVPMCSAWGFAVASYQAAPASGGAAPARRLSPVRRPPTRHV